MQRQPDERLAACLLRYQTQLRDVQRAGPAEAVITAAVDERTGWMYASAYTYAELLAELADDAETLDALATLRAHAAELDPALTVILAGLVTPAGQVFSVVAAMNLQTEENAARNCDLIFSLSCRGRNRSHSKRKKQPA